MITDVHESGHCAPAAEAGDILQIPAFLCRQTDLLIAAGNTGKPINVKGNSLPLGTCGMWRKRSHSGNQNILLCERGTSFGYNTLVNDFRGLQIMAETDIL